MNINETLFNVYISAFNKDGEAALKAICNCVVPSQVVLQKYKSLPPIEQMDEKEKREMKAYVIALFPEKTIKQKLEACKIIYTIGCCI